MEIKEIQNKKTEVTVDILCDCCGKSCKVQESIITNESRVDNGEKMYDFEYMVMHGVWGYSSKKDGECWVAYICEKCVDEKFPFVKFFKHKHLE
jgi:hypothetical protein